MRRHLVALSMIMASSAALADAPPDPVSALWNAYMEAQKPKEGIAHFKSTRGFCLNTMLFTSNGPVVYPQNRVCNDGVFVGRDFANQFVASYRLQFVHRNAWMDLIYIPNGTLTTAPKGNFYFVLNYDAYGNLSEATATNDAMP